MRVFISHSSSDVEIAGLLIALLRNALNLSSEVIRCSSVGGYGLPAGASTDETLRQEVHDSELLIGLITPRSINSMYVLFELGARWGAGKPMFPILASGATWENLEGPLSSIHALDCSNRSQVQQIIEDAGRVLNAGVDRPSAYLDVIDQLVAASAAAEPAAASHAGQGIPVETGQIASQPAATSEGPALSDPAQCLLIEASKDNAGPIRKFRSAAGTRILVSTKEFTESMDPRTVAKWQAALEELVNHDLVRDPTGRDLMFEMTNQGFRIADELRAARNSEK